MIPRDPPQLVRQPCNGCVLNASMTRAVSPRTSHHRLTSYTLTSLRVLEFEAARWLANSVGGIRRKGRVPAPLHPATMGQIVR